MADQKTIDKVKELLETNAYAPLKEAAEKWLATADEKYDVKDKAAKAWDKLGDAADAFAGASEKFNEKMGEMSDKVTDAADKLQDKAEPVLDILQDKAEPALEKISDAELIKKLKESISTFTENIELFGSEKGAEIVGSKELADQIKQHAEEMKAQGKEFCDCEACTKAKEILKDLGEDIGE
ncbi:MAG: hypothetical protein IJH57_05755 [Mogibacterium sp.]|nr:hypothetical protein [Mogibacterium sp.]